MQIELETCPKCSGQYARAGDGCPHCGSKQVRRMSEAQAYGFVIGGLLGASIGAVAASLQVGAIGILTGGIGWGAIGALLGLGVGSLFKMG